MKKIFIQSIIQKFSIAAWPALALISGATPARADEPVPRGVLRPVQRAELVSDIAQPVIRLGARAGERFRKGDTLIAFDCRRQKAEHAAAHARLREMKLVLDNNLYLDKRNVGSRSETETSRARFDYAAAEAEGVAARVDRCEMKAPFDGIVAELGIHEHETPTPTKPYMTIVGDRDFEAIIVVPSRWLRWLKPGAPFSFTVDENGAVIDGKVERIGGEIDSVSQTITIYGRLKSIDNVVAGMTGSATFHPQGN